MHLVAGIGRAFVDGRHGDHRLKLVHLRRTHVVYLLETNQCKFGQGDFVVFRHAVTVGLRKEVPFPFTWQQPVHPGGLVIPLFAD